MNYLIETERLQLREFTLDDAEFIIELLNSPDWIKYIGNRSVKTVEQAKAYLENGAIKSYYENGYGLWMVEEKKEHKPIGMCGIINRDNLEHPDIGFAFLPQYYSMGYAFESATATLDYAINQLRLNKILAITVAYNHKSIRLLEKIGLKFMKKFHLPDDEEELMMFSN